MYNKIKELAIEQRPYEKCLKYGPKVLSDTELIAVVIKSGTKEMSSLDVARQVLLKPDNSISIHSICTKSIDEIRNISGIGEVKALTLKCIAEISERIVNSTFSNGFKMNSPSVIANFYMERMRYLDHEEFMAVFLNSANMYISDRVMTVGTVSSSIVSPRELFISALEVKAVNIIVVHNHPSGEVTPSDEDIKVTHTLIEAGNIININILDHIIIGDRKYISFRECGLL